MSTKNENVVDDWECIDDSEVSKWTLQYDSVNYNLKRFCKFLAENA